MVEMKNDLYMHILPERWPDLAVKFGDGPWVSLSQPQRRRATPS